MLLAPGRVLLQNALVIGLRSKKRAIEVAVSQIALCQLRHRDDGEATSEIPAEFILDEKAINRLPRLGTIIEQIELNGQRVGDLFD